MAENNSYRRSQMQKEMVLQRLREKGCRITKQRRMLLDIILEEDCSCCKEIYYKAVKIDESIGVVTIYRMLNTLEDIGAINRREMYKLRDGDVQKNGFEDDSVYSIEFDDDTSIKVSAKKLGQIVNSGLRMCGYEKNVRRVCIKA